MAAGKCTGWIEDMKDNRTQNISCIREMLETARRVAFRIKALSDIPSCPELLGGRERQCLLSHLRAVHAWADGLLQAMEHFELQKSVSQGDGSVDAALSDNAATGNCCLLSCRDAQ